MSAYSLWPMFFFLMTPLPPRSTLFPYTTLFRSGRARLRERGHLLLLLQLGRRRGQRPVGARHARVGRSEEHTSELQSQSNLVCRLLLEKKKTPPSAATAACFAAWPSAIRRARSA